MELDEKQVNHLARKMYEEERKAKPYQPEWAELEGTTRSFWRQLSKLAIIDVIRWGGAPATTVQAPAPPPPPAPPPKPIDLTEVEEVRRVLLENANRLAIFCEMQRNT